MERKIPFVWPALRDCEAHTDQPPVADLLNGAGACFGLVWDLNVFGLELLRQAHNSQPDLKTKLIVAVYAASPTNEKVLRDLMTLVEALGGRLDCRLLAANVESTIGASTALMVSGKSSLAVWMDNAG